MRKNVQKEEGYSFIVEIENKNIRNPSGN